MKTLKNVKLGTKMAFGFAIPLVIMMAVIAIVFGMVNTMESDAALAKDESAVFTRIARQMKLDVVEIQQWLQDISATRGMDGLNDGFDKAQNSYDSFMDGLAKFKDMYEEENSADGLEQVAELEKNVIAYYEVGKTMATAYVDGGPESGNKLMASFDEAAENMSNALAPFIESQETELVEAMTSIVSSANVIQSFTLIAGIMGVLTGAIIAWLTTRSITKPILKAVEFAKTMSQGDLTHKLDIDQADEIGVLGKSLNEMGENLRKMFKDIGNGVETLASSSTELASVSEQMSSGAENTSNKSNAVATASEEMSSNMTSVAAAMEQASTNISIVTSSTEQMTASINEIAQNTERASTVTGQAVTEAQSASAKVNELGTAADEIGKVTETITEISEQTNLLALNATIEAARAGDAGKGFAVVANEIKELANQTAEATEEIRSKIEGIQGSTGETVTEIEKITKVIGEVNDIVSTIASAVEEQSVTTKEIAGNVVQASQGISEVNENVAQTSSVAGEIAKDIADVNQASSGVVDGSGQVSTSAVELSKLSEQLKEMVVQFKV